MTGEEMERAIEILLRNQANFDARMDRHEAAQRRTQEQLDQTQVLIDQTQTQLNHLTKVVASIADQTQRNSEDINVLVRIVDRLVEGRNGGS